MNTKYTHFAIGVLLGALLMTVGGDYFEGVDEATVINELRAQYYASEVATMVSPHNVRERISHGDTGFILVDVRAEEDYVREHVVGAINIDSGRDLDKVLADFKALPDNKEIIIYCYSAACMNGRKAGNFLAENNVYVQEMTIGWNEWRYGWQMWNYDTEWDTYTVEDYVISGSEPGELPESVGMPAPCPIGGSLSC
ncbi:MAG: rhodanese-related sulfurtransferase [Acidimicrobiales bacterium]|jgi:rhodanese-related sulfurtransferase